MILPPELVACILKMEGNYFFWKQTNRMQKITKLNEMLSLHKFRLIVVFSYFELELHISKNKSYVIRRYNCNDYYNIVFKRNHGVLFLP
jgi:hypothetical protein